MCPRKFACFGKKKIKLFFIFINLMTFYNFLVKQLLKITKLIKINNEMFKKLNSMKWLS